MKRYSETFIPYKDVPLEALQKLKLFDKTSANDLERLLVRAKLLRIMRGRSIIVEGPSANETICVLLSGVVKVSGDARGTIINLPLSRDGLAELIGASRQTVSLEIKDLVRRGRVIRDGRRLLAARARRAHQTVARFEFTRLCARGASNVDPGIVDPALIGLLHVHQEMRRDRRSSLHLMELALADETRIFSASRPERLQSSSARCSSFSSSLRCRSISRCCS